MPEFLRLSGVRPFVAVFVYCKWQAEERETEIERMCAYVCDRETETERMCAYVGDRERERERERENERER